jgi:hypothetical protein
MELLRCIYLEDIAVLATYFQKSMAFTLFRVGFRTEFSFEKIPLNIDSEQFPLFRGRQHSFRGIPSSAEEPISKLGTERNGMDSAEQISFRKQQQSKLTK